MTIRVPRWATSPPVGYVGAVEPSEGEKDNGWQNGERPAAGHMNWLLQKQALWTSPDPQSDPTLLSVIELDREIRAAQDSLARPFTSVDAHQWVCADCGSLPQSVADLPGGGSASYQATGSPFIAGATTGSSGTLKVGTLIGSLSLVGGDTISAKAVAIRTGLGYGNMPAAAAVFVGDGGVWYKVVFGEGGVATQSTGTISAGSPNLKHVIWDGLHGLWWTCGDSGIWSAPEAASLVWTNRNNDHFFSNLLLLPSGRVCCMRNNGDMWISDTQTSFANLGFASGTDYTPNFPVYDNAVGAGFWIDRVAGSVLVSPDGQAKTIYTLPSGNPSSAMLGRFRGRALLAWGTNSFSPNTLRTASYTRPVNVDPNTWRVVTAQSGAGDVGGANLLRGCGEVVLALRSSNLWSSQRLVDIDGSMSP